MGVLKDPDQICLDHAAEALRPELNALGVKAGKAQATNLARVAIWTWCVKRPVEWSRERTISFPGEPDATNIGWAEKILPLLAETQGVPFKKPIHDWTKDEMALFIATAFELISEQRVATLERDMETVLYD